MKILLTYEPGDAHLERLRAAAPSSEIVIATELESAIREIVDADAMLGNRYFLQSLPAARRLRWMQSGSMGVDLILAGLEARPSFVMTSVRGVYDQEISEHAVALVMAVTRGLHLFHADRVRRVWSPRPLATVHGRTALILGWGGVGRATGMKLRALGATVRGAARRSCNELEGEVVSGSEWRRLLPESSMLIMALPLTPETRSIVGENELRSLPRDAVVVNVGRGATLDERALVRMLDEGHLGGAGLDVFEQEPLDPSSPIWDHPGIVMTPHVGRSTETRPRRWEPLFEENLLRFCAGETLINVVDIDAGY